VLGLGSRSLTTAAELATATALRAITTLRTVSVTTEGTTRTRTATLAARRTVGDGAALVLDLVGTGLEGEGNDISGDVEVAAEELDALRGEVPVEPAPVESLSDKLARDEGLHEADHGAVADLGDEVVLGGKEVLLGDHDTLTEKIGINLVAELLRNYHFEI